MIEGVKVKDLRPVPDDRGMLMEILRSDDPDFQRFGQVYITWVYPASSSLALPQDTDRPLRSWPAWRRWPSRRRKVSPTRRKRTTSHRLAEAAILIHPGASTTDYGHRYEPAGIIKCPTNFYDHDDPDDIQAPLRLAETGTTGVKRREILVCGGAGSSRQHVRKRMLTACVARDHQPGQAHLRWQPRQPAGGRG